MKCGSYLQLVCIKLEPLLATGEPETHTMFESYEMLQVGYFNWWLVGAYILLLSVFLYGILQPRKKSEWKSAGVAQAWVVALYAEMYGTPLTAYLVMNFLGRTKSDAEQHFNGHLWPVLFGFSEQNLIIAQFWFTLFGQMMILIGALLAIVGWRQLYQSVKAKKMADSGLYRYIRHPQYTGFFLFLLGSMINWPTLITMLTLPVLWLVYLKLARDEEQIAIRQFGARYLEYMRTTGRFLPKLRFQS